MRILSDLEAAHEAQMRAKDRMDRAWSEYCRARAEWERLDREGSAVFDKIINADHRGAGTPGEFGRPGY